MTRGRTVLNGVLLAVVAVLAAAVWLAPDRHRAPPAPRLLSAAAADRFTDLRIRRHGKPEIRLHRAAGGPWRIDAPLRAPANEVSVQAVTALAGAGSDRAFPAAGRDLAAFGLAAPEARLWLDDTAIVIGGTEPISGRRYVRVGDTIHLIPDFYINGVLAPPTAFVSLSLLPPGRRPVRFTLPGLEIRRGADGRWRRTGGTAPAAELQAFVRRWRSAQALDVEPAGAAAPGRDTITLAMDAGAPAVFDIVGRGDELVLARRDLGVAYHLPGDAAAGLLRLQPPPAVK